MNYARREIIVAVFCMTTGGAAFPPDSHYAQELSATRKAESERRQAEGQDEGNSGGVDKPW